MKRRCGCGGLGERLAFRISCWDGDRKGVKGKGVKGRAEKAEKGEEAVERDAQWFIAAGRAVEAG